VNSIVSVHIFQGIPVVSRVHAEQLNVDYRVDCGNHIRLCKLSRSCCFWLYDAFQTSVYNGNTMWCYVLCAACSYLIAAGDPCQLPPVLASPTGVTPAAAAAQAPGINPAAGQLQQRQQPGSVAYGLLRPLFVRLTHLGHEPHLLTHQYRYATNSTLGSRVLQLYRIVVPCQPAQRGIQLPTLD
jgi:hypothetical protein